MDGTPGNPTVDEDTLRCRRCGRERTAEELDGMLWCEECIAAERQRAAWWGRGIALVAAVLLAVWIALVIRPGSDFRVLWAVLLVFAWFLFTRLAREISYGVIRIRNRPGVRATDRPT
ncbi:MAG TPA: hypothetical protein VK966_11760 [Longimicrobiales bacterium]|nr:hypothetical protein [Longimicrobiales bacterium]